MDYFELNRQNWNILAEHHVGSDFYDVKSFLEGRSSLNGIELGLLGDIKGKSVLHLQCHFGQDTISLARMGATVTGVDLSDKAIEYAEQFAAETGADARFICCNVYDLPEHLDQEFDIVFTSYGTIGWLPDLDQWASVVSRFLRQGGIFVFADFHPLVWMFDNDFKQVSYSYFNTGPIVETEKGTYADRQADITREYAGWNHGIGEVVNSLLAAGLQLTQLNEYNYSPHNCFRGMVEMELGKFTIEHLGAKIPMVYSLTALKGF
jgi:2-polyprenyl-3-methyl-5-hydroxy-6-metoxy-1,4-benzoquinol methylase